MTQKERDLMERIFQLGRAVGVKEMAKVSINVYDKLDRETPFKMPMWAYESLHTPLGEAEDYLAERGKE